MYAPQSLAVDPATGNIAVAGALGAQSWERDPSPGQRLAGSVSTSFDATYTPAGHDLGVRAISYSGSTLIPAFADDDLYLRGHTHLQTLETYAPGEGNMSIVIGKRGVYLLKVG